MVGSPSHVICSLQMIYVSHYLLSFSSSLLAVLGISLFRNAIYCGNNESSRQKTQTLGLALIIISVLASVLAGTSFWTRNGFDLLTIGSGILWFLSAMIGPRFFKSRNTIKYLSLATTTGLILWWVMRDGKLAAGENFLLVALGIWILISIAVELKEVGKNQNSHKLINRGKDS